MKYSKDVYWYFGNGFLITVASVVISLLYQGIEIFFMVGWSWVGTIAVFVMLAGALMMLHGLELAEYERSINKRKEEE